MTAQNLTHKDNLKLLAIITTISLVFMLSALSIASYKKFVFTNVDTTERVLGIEYNNDEKVFWINFLGDNPYYFPGWKRLNEISLEIGDKELQAQTRKALIRLKPNNE